jgi:hypothetical protein
MNEPVTLDIVKMQETRIIITNVDPELILQK